MLSKRMVASPFGLILTICAGSHSIAPVRLMRRRSERIAARVFAFERVPRCIKLAYRATQSQIRPTRKRHLTNPETIPYSRISLTAQLYAAKSGQQELPSNMALKPTSRIGAILRVWMHSTVSATYQSPSAGWLSAGVRRISSLPKERARFLETPPHCIRIFYTSGQT
jgi:hypothetical protein